MNIASNHACIVSNLFISISEFIHTIGTIYIVCIHKQSYYIYFKFNYFKKTFICINISYINKPTVIPLNHH